MSKWNEHTERGIYLFFGGLLILLVHYLMLHEVTNDYYADHTRIDNDPEGAFGTTALYYLTLAGGVITTIFGSARLIKGLCFHKPYEPRKKT